jgi:hypothetical protein
MSKNISKGSQSQKNPQIQEVRSADDLCKRLNELLQKPEWNTETADQFINLIINTKKQFNLDAQQQDKVVTAIINCPLKYRAIVHLAIIYANYSSETGIRTLDKIIPRINSFISESLELEEGIKENILKNLGEKRVIQFIKERVNAKNDFLRNLIALLIFQGEESAIASRLNIILDILANSNHYEKLTASQLDSNIDLKNRVKAVVEIFQLAKPNANEAKRLLLYGTHAQIISSQQGQKIARLKESLDREQKLCEQKENEISQLKQQCQVLNQKLVDIEKTLEQERELYAQLETSSQIQISQQRETTLNKVRNRIEHELNKLERCLNSSGDSFQENSQIGLRIIQRIREQLTE